MRILPKAALTAALTATVLAATAAPALAIGPFTCPKGEDVCVYVSGSFPVSNTVTFGPLGTTARYVALPAICDSTGTDCTTVYVGVPGALVGSTGGTLGTLHVPGTGFGLNTTTGASTLYVTSIPTFTPSGTGLGASGSVALHDFPVLVVNDGIGYECGYPSSTTVGPVTVAHVGCATTVTVRV